METAYKLWQYRGPDHIDEDRNYFIYPEDWSWAISFSYHGHEKLMWARIPVFAKQVGEMDVIFTLPPSGSGPYNWRLAHFREWGDFMQWTQDRGPDRMITFDMYRIDAEDFPKELVSKLNEKIVMLKSAPRPPLPEEYR